MNTPKKLIEVAMPIKEISAESVRDKSIRHGHISTLHLWWARRPLPVCRAVVFASLVPDPLDPHCPPAFKEAIEILLGREHNFGDPYQPYKDIPWTSVYDPMEDNLRNRLQMFIGKFTDEMQQHLLHHKPKPGSNNQLSNYSLIKWENKNDDEIINKARKLIWVAYNSENDPLVKATTLVAAFDEHYNAIKTAEQELYNIPDRYIITKKTEGKTQKLENAITQFLNKMPKVFDPFAGGGAIPLEAARLGCRSFGNDINPVAHIIQKGSLEFPQKFGKPLRYSKGEFIKRYGKDVWNDQPQFNKIVEAGNIIGVNVENRLSFDVKYFGNKLIANCSRDMAHFFPKSKDGYEPFVYYWARIGKCSNPTCKTDIPLLNQFYISKRRTAGTSDWVYLHPIIKSNKISFEIKKGITKEEGWVHRKNMKCPVCGNVTEVNKLKEQFKKSEVQYKLLCIIEEKDNKRNYRIPTKEEIKLLDSIPDDLLTKPHENLPIGNNRDLHCMGWGIEKWGDIFTNRQLAVLNCFTKNLFKIAKVINHEEKYKNSILTYLGILINRIASRGTSIGVWHILQETVEHPFGRQSLPMKFDFPEINTLGNSSGSALGQLEAITKYIDEESRTPFFSFLFNASSGEKGQFKSKGLTAAITDPPYYDAIAYADLSDFFYVWFKRSISDLYPLIFATPLTPKSDECTALKHHHNNDAEKSKRHFENKLQEIFAAIEIQTSDIVSIMFAHQSTEAWTTLCNSILGANMNITGSWPIDTEVTGAIKNDLATLASSVTVSCRPTQSKGVGEYKTIKKAIEETVGREVIELYQLGFRGADLLTACFGKAVSEFGKYKKVEKADGSEVTVAELLAMSRESAFNALLKGFDGDDFTKFYIGWLQLYGFTESDFDDAAKFSRVGLKINVQQLFSEHILIKDHNRQTLGSFDQRLSRNKTLGEKASSFLIDQVHKAMALFKGTNRSALLLYIDKVASQPESNFWRVVTSLCEVLPAGSDDHKQATGLLTNKDSLIRESKTIRLGTTEQTKLFE